MRIWPDVTQFNSARGVLRWIGWLKEEEKGEMPQRLRFLLPIKLTFVIKKKKLDLTQPWLVDPIDPTCNVILFYFLQLNNITHMRKFNLYLTIVLFVDLLAFLSIIIASCGLRWFFLSKNVNCVILLFINLLIFFIMYNHILWFEMIKLSLSI